MHNDRTIVEDRITRELFERIVPHVHSDVLPLTVEVWHAPGEPVSADEAAAQDYGPYVLGTAWGKPWGTSWFRCTVDVPDAWVGDRLEAVLDLGFYAAGPGFQAEGLVWLEGEPLQGVHPRRTSVPLAGVGPGRLQFFVEAAANPVMGPGYGPNPMGSLDTAPDRPLYRVRRADLAVRNDDVFGLTLDIEVLDGLMRALHADDPRRSQLLRTLEQALNAVDVRDVSGTAAGARAILAPALATPARPSALSVVGVGHAHIDTAWLWPMRETVRKCARTFASATRLMDDYPEYHFVCSQAVQYDWMERQYLALFERITERVASGQFVPVGGMWVEADMNLPSGESLVRQLVHGQRYFQSRFGVRCTEVWIPDVFGYPASLPQIFAAGGCDRFVTQKLSWNKQNRFPHNTFWWEGLDGSRVLTHFPPVDTYNAEVTGGEMVFSERNFSDHGWSRNALMPFGYGNGGGGPTREMLERARRMADLDGVPTLAIGTTNDFFTAVEAEAAAGAPVPQWRGELYFEMHRGTLTSQIRTKLGNRRCERLLREAELWWAAGGAVPTGVADEFDDLWKQVLVQQFHDILPGSSIAWVHADAEAAFERVGDRVEQLIADALGRLGLGAGLHVANAATHARAEVIDLDGCAVMVSVPGSAVAPLVERSCDDVVTTTDRSMANESVAVTWDANGTITSITDLRCDRELLPTGRSVDVELAPDQPVEYDAWDLESWTHGLGSPLAGDATVQWVRRDPLVASVCVRRAVGDASSIELTYTLTAGSPRLDIGIDVDWHESERLLSLMIPLDVHAPEASCDIQFGQVRRPTHASSPWDAAKFEVCAHRFVDLAEPSFGVAVLNNGRFGHGLFDGGIRVSLMRAARFPDPDADQGRHHVTVAVLPHGPGTHEVLAHAAALNMPLRVVTGASGQADGGQGGYPPPVVTVDHPGVELSAVKRADPAMDGGPDTDGQADGGPAIGGQADGTTTTPDDLIVRLNEACGDRARVTVQVGGGASAAWRCNLLEEPLEPVAVIDGSVTLDLRPFELVTLRFAP